MKQTLKMLGLLMLIAGLAMLYGCEKKAADDPAGHDHAAHAAQEGVEQTLCPVMDGPINKQFFVEYQGKTVYFCCSGCEKTFLENPEKYLPKLPQFQK